MKIFIKLTLIGILFILFASCKKETKVEVQNITDTLYTEIPITISTITANKWMIEETKSVLGGNIVYYLRGGSSNTINFDDEHYKFNVDFTGSHQEDNTIQRPITWSFLNAENTKLIIHFTNTPANFDVIWENIRTKNSKLYYDEYFTDGNTGKNSHGQFIRIFKP